ncbi:hypothetical protein D3C71_835130 [compost metagenome]
MHRRGSGVGGKTVNCQGEPTLAHCGANQSDVDSLIFQNRALLDMQFVTSVHRKCAGRQGAAIADGIQRFAYRYACVIGAREGVLFAKLPGPDTGGQHRRREACAFFIGPVYQHDIALGFNAVVVERAQHFQPGQHAVDPVVISAERLRVNVRSGHNRRQGAVFPGAADKHIAHAVDVTGETCFQRPVAQQIAHDPILFTEGQTRYATGGRAADLRHHPERGPKPLRIDVDHALSFFVW